MLILTADKTQLFLRTNGNPESPAILLIHGLGADHRMWVPQIDPFTAAGFYVVSPDMRSHGKSEAVDFSIEACARDLQGLLERLEIEKAHLVGVSMGGLIAQQMACDFPENVHKIVICDSFSGVNSVNERFNAQLAAMLLAVLPNKFLTTILISTYQRMGRNDVAAYFAKVMAEADVQNLRAARKAVNAFNIFERLSEIQQPTLVLVGDKFGKMAVEMARKTADGIQTARFKILAGGGDPSNMLVPGAFNREVLGFLK
jgi:3-oxoadipate enol-lactonase